MACGVAAVNCDFASLMCDGPSRSYSVRMIARAARTDSSTGAPKGPTKSAVPEGPPTASSLWVFIEGNLYRIEKWDESVAGSRLGFEQPVSKEV